MMTNQQCAEVITFVQSILDSEEVQIHFSANGLSLTTVSEIQEGLDKAQIFNQFSSDLFGSTHYTETQWQTDFRSAQRTYQEYVAQVRIAYQDEQDVLCKLRIDRVAPTDQEAWLDHARFFYTNVTTYSHQLSQKCGLKTEVWVQALVEIHALISADHQHQSKTTEQLGIPQSSVSATSEESKSTTR